MNPKRVRQINDFPERAGPVIYWMSRDQRVRDNWALVFAQELAEMHSAPLAVVFCLAPSFGEATIRHYGFMLRGLREVEAKLAGLGIPFFLMQGFPGEVLPAFLKAHQAGALVTDFDPLRIKRAWKSDVVAQLEIAAYEVDAHNIVPCWVASPKQEFGAYTLRPKIARLLPEFTEEFPQLTPHPVPWQVKPQRTDWEQAEASLDVDHSVPEVSWIQPGEDAAADVLADFVQNKLAAYPQKRNDPSQDGQSNLSPYLHFGQISAQRVALSINESSPGAPEFLEELIVRRELSDNFCFYNENYDSLAGFPDWARKTLEAHRNDPRPTLYSLEELEQSQTQDLLWNACQTEMVVHGKMHGYMRMYWAKKILEWTNSPEEAQQICNYLNDRYELDGRDPNGYTGIAWSIGGVRDRAWGERPIFGKIRYMSYAGCARKFDVDAYVEKVRKVILTTEAGTTR